MQIFVQLLLQILYAHTQTYIRKHTHTCFRIPAAISWPQSKMIWNSFPLFISFKSGLASLVSAGSCRIFNRMLYRDGAFISSCNRIRPVGRATKKENVFYSFCLLSKQSLLFKTMNPAVIGAVLLPWALHFQKWNFKYQCLSTVIVATTTFVRFAVVGLIRLRIRKLQGYMFVVHSFLIKSISLQYPPCSLLLFTILNTFFFQCVSVYIPPSRSLSFLSFWYHPQYI